MIGTATSFTAEYLDFLISYPNHLPTILLATINWMAIVIYLFATNHAEMLGNVPNNVIGCGDKRVRKALVIFGGPAGMTFGIPYYLLAAWVVTNPLLKEYLFGFVFLGAATSLAQALVLLLFAPFKREGWDQYLVILFKSHLGGCGWITGTGPFFLLYWVQQILQWSKKNLAAKTVSRIRDFETIILFGFSLVSPMVIVCLLSSLTLPKLVVPILTGVDGQHQHQTDQSQRYQASLSYPEAS